MANFDESRLASLVIREMESNPLVRFHFTPIDWRNLISLLTPSVGKDEKKQELLPITDGSKFSNIFSRQSGHIWDS